MTARFLPTPLLMLVATELAKACDCMPPPDPQARFDEATVVFTGTVLESIVESTPHWKKAYRFQVHRTFKGASRSELLIDHGASKNCAFTFESGATYLVYAFGQPTALTANICSATQKLECH